MHTFVVTTTQSCRSFGFHVEMRNDHASHLGTMYLSDHPSVRPLIGTTYWNVVMGVLSCDSGVLLAFIIINCTIKTTEHHLGDVQNPSILRRSVVLQASDTEKTRCVRIARFHSSPSCRWYSFFGRRDGIYWSGTLPWRIPSHNFSLIAMPVFFTFGPC